MSEPQPDYFQEVASRTVKPLCQRHYAVADVRALNARAHDELLRFVRDELPKILDELPSEGVVHGLVAIRWQQRLANFHFRTLGEYRKGLLALPEAPAPDGVR